MANAAGRKSGGWPMKPLNGEAREPRTIYRRSRWKPWNELTERQREVYDQARACKFYVEPRNEHGNRYMRVLHRTELGRTGKPKDVTTTIRSLQQAGWLYVDGFAGPKPRLLITFRVPKGDKGYTDDDE